MWRYWPLWRHFCLPFQVIYFTATFPYLVLIILLVRGVTLDGYEKGLEFYLVPKFDKLADPRVKIRYFQILHIEKYKLRHCDNVFGSFIRDGLIFANDQWLTLTRCGRMRPLRYSTPWGQPLAAWSRCPATTPLTTTVTGKAYQSYAIKLIMMYKRMGLENIYV